VERRETLIVVFTDDWSLCWDLGEGTPVNTRNFKGAGAILVLIEPRCSHALANNGAHDLFVIGISDRVFDAHRPDAIARGVV
jgi:hypothetical protein